MKINPIACAAAILLVSSAQAQPITYWQRDQHFSVGSIVDPRVGAISMLRANQRAAAGYASWGFAVGIQAAAFDYSEDGVIFNKPSTLKVQIDKHHHFCPSHGQRQQPDANRASRYPQLADIVP